ncbi:MAG: Holliday junction branch migration protein RuvA [Pseudorhodobacter sp.]|nr:Holliday junction branch migration protein RuvA [Pseudorhodobacter sp.]
MIGRLAGVILHRGMDQVLIDVRGVGYIVHVSARTAAALPPVGEATALYTELLVREDLLQLFGFPTLYEKEWHRLLVSVQGVGAKAALAILGTLGPDALARAIALGDWATVRAAPGIGPKLAQRVVLELKGKAPSVMALGGALSVDLAPGDDVPEAAPGPRKSAAAAPQTSASAEALSALTNLGYSAADAASAVAEASAAPDATDTAKLIRAALRLLAPKS